MSEFRIEHTRRLLEDALMQAVSYSVWRLGKFDEWLEIEVYAGRYRRGPGKRPSKKDMARYREMGRLDRDRPVV